MVFTNFYNLDITLKYDKNKNKKIVPSVRLELTTYNLEGCYSIQLS